MPIKNMYLLNRLFLLSQPRGSLSGGYSGGLGRTGALACGDRVSDLINLAVLLEKQRHQETRPLSHQD